MFSNFVSSIKNRLATKIGDESFKSRIHSTDIQESQNIFLKLLNAGYSIVNQNQDDSFCNENLFMLPRVCSKGSENITGLWSPISLRPPEKSLDELDNVVEKFIRCINMENHRDSPNRKNDREAIRRRLAMGEEDDYFTDLAASRPIRKPNLQSRLQNGRNLQICFMNEAASDSESSDSETCPKLSQGMNRKKNLQRPSSLMYHRNASLNNNPYNSRPLSVVRSVLDGNEKVERPSTLHLIQASDPSDNNFFTQQARLQIEARMALAQAKDMAHMQMEIEKQKQGMCPITDLVHRTLGKVGLKASPSKRRLSRQMLTTMNIAQLQIIINEFHTFIETLNEMLVKYLMDRDDLSMRQDSMLIDIEDITRYLAEKEEAKLNYGSSKTKPQPQKHYIEVKPIQAKRITSVTLPRQQTPSITSYNQNKKFLVVNGNGHTVKTSISREKIEQNGLHL
ncbi:CLUMA_CG014480, isoform A [Clunio marinus]|uniref:CLUMA_CG014480, isoform A n=1 Tax=Clunio marinus TaxID=568069 RepID=A0A1J1IMG0_9DIPT|nr:CLUMA_CG014480, isoform A [Clunio marinus]